MKTLARLHFSCRALSAGLCGLGFRKPQWPQWSSFCITLGWSSMGNVEVYRGFSSPKLLNWSKRMGLCILKLNILRMIGVFTETRIFESEGNEVWPLHSEGRVTDAVLTRKEGKNREKASKVKWRAGELRIFLNLENKYGSLSSIWMQTSDSRKEKALTLSVKWVWRMLHASTNCSRCNPYMKVSIVYGSFDI